MPHDSQFMNQTTRRGLLRMGVVGLGGLTLPHLLQQESTRASEGSRTAAKAKSVILLYLNGGPSQLDMWDPKPAAPKEIRGTFQPIDSNVPGIQFSEHLPRMARLTDKCTIIRSMHHAERGHPKANYWMLTGRKVPLTRRARVRTLSREDHPHLGSVVAKTLGASTGMPPFVMLPQRICPTGINDPHPGQFAGYLGAAYDPYLIDSDPNLPDYSPGPLRRRKAVSANRLTQRQTLLAQINRKTAQLSKPAPTAEFDVYYQKALGLITSSAAQGAFDVSQEPIPVRDNYGRHSFGQSALMARRLVEAGVRLVHVNWTRMDNGKGGQGYDSHSNHLAWSKETLLPPTDAAFAALVEDLDQRGLLDETLVVMLGEFGRTPRFNANGGRDHWPNCFSLVMAGGGVRGGHIYGSSDKTAAYPASNPVQPADLLATVYHQLGIDHHGTAYDQLSRPFPLSEGHVITDIL